MHGVENVTEFKQNKTEEALYQLEAVRMVMSVRARVAQFLSLLNGVPAEEILATMPENVMPSVVGADAQPSGVMRMGSPQQDGNGASATSQVMT
jgi:hypothetical protein